LLERAPLTLGETQRWCRGRLEELDGLPWWMVDKTDRVVCGDRRVCMQQERGVIQVGRGSGRRGASGGCGAVAT